MKKMQFLIGLLSFLFLSHAIASTTNTKPINLLLGSTLYYGSDNEAPFVLKGNGAMDTWEFSDKFGTLPADIKWFIAESISCIDKTCLMAGGFNTYAQPKNPNALISISEDGGVNWAIKNVTPERSRLADLKNIYCDHDQCLATGYYQNENAQKELFILTSHDHFASWQQIKNIAGLNTNTVLSNFATDCANEYCVMAASFASLTEKTEKPLFLVTNKDKTNWSLAASDELIAKGIVFEKVSCSKNTCVAVGYYFKNVNSLHTLLYVSLDRGLTWQEKKIDDDLANIRSVKCKNNFCIAVGMSNKVGRQDKGLLIVSNDAGNTWQSKTLDTPQNNYFYLTDVDCTDHFCVTGGTYYNPPGANQFFIYVSHDQGNTWSQIKKIENMPHIDIPGSTGLSCNEQNCVYSFEDGKIKASSIPIIMVSDQSGDKWHVVSRLLNMPWVNTAFVDVNYHGKQIGHAASLNNQTNIVNQIKQNERAF